MLIKVAQSRQSPNERKIAQSGHPGVTNEIFAVAQVVESIHFP
jgi:hypothetical protein